jgi:peptidoglycan hydrolase-like protein with peptidoglycan-binding domain
MALKSARFKSDARLQRAAENNPPINRGESGQAVRIIQQALIDLGFPLPISTRGGCAAAPFARLGFHAQAATAPEVDRHAANR